MFQVVWEKGGQQNCRVHVARESSGQDSKAGARKANDTTSVARHSLQDVGFQPLLYEQQSGFSAGLPHEDHQLAALNK